MRWETAAYVITNEENCANPTRPLFASSAASLTSTTELSYNYEQED